MAAYFPSWPARAVRLVAVLYDLTNEEVEVVEGA